MDRRGGNAEPSDARLARSYLGERAEQSTERQPRSGREDARHTVRLPSLNGVHLNSPEARSQYRLAFLARLRARGEPWFTLAVVAAR